MQPLFIIPARIASTRLPNKPLADIGGKPMIVHSYEKAKSANVGRIVVATDDRKIKSVIEAIGGEAIITDPALPSGSDRTYAAAEILDPERKHDIVVNVQGDMPLMDKSIISDVLLPLNNKDIDISTLVCEFVPQTDEDLIKLNNPAIVKAILSWNGDIANALYFTRANAPYNAKIFYHHVGIYAFRRDILQKFVSLGASELEKYESLEQLRALEAGMRIGVARTKNMPYSVDTAEQLEVVREEYVKIISSNRNNKTV